MLQQFVDPCILVWWNANSGKFHQQYYLRWPIVVASCYSKRNRRAYVLSEFGYHASVKQPNQCHF